MKKIKLGILGTRRGRSFLRLAKSHDELEFEVVAICDKYAHKLKGELEELNVRLYTDFDDMLRSDIDAVVLANYFHEHTPFAIKALQAGKHVLSETTSASTLKECVELCDAVEKSDSIYMLAENYAFTKMGLEMKVQYQNNLIGDVIYADGEYVHPIEADEFNKISVGINHWRNHAPSTYYCTHALAPLMYFTDTYPVAVNSLSIAKKELQINTAKSCDPTSVILCTMNNGSVFRLYGWNSPGHSIWYRLHGTLGSMEAPRQYDGGYFGDGMLHISIDKWQLKENQQEVYGFLPKWPEHLKKAGSSSHGGGDFVVLSGFKDAIRSGKSPEFFDVYKGVSLSAVGILAWRSALNKGSQFEIIDFKDKEKREIYREDDISPFPDAVDKPRIQNSLDATFKPSEKDLKYAQKIWDEIK